jgi:NB-ARC domain/Rx N-terminal domain
MSGAESLIGGWFASAIIARVLFISEIYLGANYQLQKDSKGLVEKLTQMLPLIQGTVRMAERTMTNNSDLVSWLRVLKAAVYDAEDVLDNLEVQSCLKMRKNKVSKIASSSIAGLKNLVFPDNDHKKLKEVVDKLEQLSSQNTTFFNLLSSEQDARSNIRQHLEQRATISQPTNLEAHLYGREDELSHILKLILDLDLTSNSWILQHDTEFSEQKKKKTGYNGLIVVPIFGMGGIGKTTLAKAVYNNSATTQIFKNKEWIYVSYEFNVALVLRKIIRSLQSTQELQEMTIQDLSSHISTINSGVRFLIVLDNMFELDEDQWDILYISLSHGVPGSVILITTQNQAFANRVGTFGHIALTPLEWSVFWKLFKNFSLGDVDIAQENRKSLKSIGKQIAQKLRGLPLAAKVIGKLLKSNLDVEYWMSISESEWWQIPEGRGQILPSVGLVYQFLDPSLRQCFAYCSLFPKNFLLDKDRIVQMWIAHNFIRPDDTDRRLEDIGEQWFEKLVKATFFEPECDAELDQIPFDPVPSNKKCYVMHDLMHDLAVIVSSGECFYLTDNSPEIPSTVRHIAVDTKEPDKLRAIRKCKHLRTLLYFGSCQVDEFYSAINDTLSKLNSIRVLDLSHLNMGKELKPPRAIRNLQHLRFLDLSCTRIEALKCSSLNHYHLQALHIQDCIFRRPPRGVDKLLNLRHLHANVETIALISHIGKLTDLQQLEVYTVGNEEGHKITELENLSEIRGPLRILNCENIINQDEAMHAELNKKKHLSVVGLSWNSEFSGHTTDIDILENLRPHNNIKDLSISNYMGSLLPNWMMQMSNFPILQKVHISSCKWIKFLPPFGHLPCLKFLHIEGLSSVKLVNYSFYGGNQKVYPSLKYFIFSSLSSCEIWTEAKVKEFFPCLSALTIKDSKVLREVPLHRFSASLKSLKLGECDRLNSLGNSLQKLTFLTHLSIGNSGVFLSLDLHYLRLLQLLSLEECPELNIEGKLQSLSHLKRLEIRSCPKLFVNYYTENQQEGTSLQEHQRDGLRLLIRIDADNSLWDHDYPKILGNLPSLRILDFKHYQQNLFTISQTSWLRELTALEELNFCNCNFEHFPGLDTLSSLKKVMLISCPRLESLRCMPFFLREFTIKDCPSSLVHRCQPEGEEWHHISHVACIQLNRLIIYNFRGSDGTAGKLIKFSKYLIILC